MMSRSDMREPNPRAMYWLSAILADSYLSTNVATVPSSEWSRVNPLTRSVIAQLQVSKVKAKISRAG